LPMVFRFLGFKGSAVFLAGVVGYGLFTGDLNGVLTGSSASQNARAQTSEQRPLKETVEEKELVQFVSTVLADTEDTWNVLFKQNGMRYKAPKLVLFRDAVQSACGSAQSAMGPFYCPGDQKVYIDLSFFSQLKNRFKAPGDFAQAYVIAHEVGHHIQTLTGVSKKVHAARKKLSEKGSNQLSVQQELQADCLAGVWANHANKTRQLLEKGDIEEGLKAATAIGDDTLQKQSGRSVSPDSFTHGSSEQRVKWFKVGLASGDMNRCDTFKNMNVQTPHYDALPKPQKARIKRENTSKIAAAYAQRLSDVQTGGKGVVARVLQDDTKGSRHQKFLLNLSEGPTILVAHNIDLAPRIPALKRGDHVEFFGEYEWSDKGGVIHWTHHDPSGRHIAGWLKHNGKKYQ